MKRFVRSLAAVVLVLTMLVSSASALTVEEALDFLELNYLQELPEEAYEAESLDELFELLGDPYTYYMNAEEYQAFVDSVEGTVNLVGIGVSIQYTKEGILVVDALEGGPALAAGFQTGDLIVAVDGVSCVPANEGHRDMILGEEGTEVTITVVREGATTDYTLKRAAVVIPNTEIEVLDGHIGYIVCSSFGSVTGALFVEGVETYNESVDCWLVDMRGNGGGYSDAAVSAIGVFAGPGYHLYLQDGRGFLYYYSYEQAASTDRLAVVLVNSDTASAAEAFAAGMRDLRRGLTVGDRTYGKGTAQVVFDGESNPELFGDDALKLTAYRFYSNGGITNDQVGVIPTLMVSDEMAYDVAMAISGSAEIAPENRLQFYVDGWNIVVDYAAMSDEALSALFEALPPTTLWLYEGEEEAAFTVEGAAERLGVSYNSRWFHDVGGARFAEAINTLATYDIIHGDGEGNFYPGEGLTRAEACAMLGKALGLEGSNVQRFDDVSAEDVCAPYINAMADLGLVVGKGGGLFCPKVSVTQQEYYTMLARIACYLNVNIGFSAAGITEEQLSMAAELGFHPWARESAVLLSDLNALHTVSEQQNPTAPILREEAAVNLYNVLISAGVLPG